MIPLRKEKCGYCHKNINIGQPISECHDCNSVIHTKCYKMSNFDKINNDFFCENYSLGVSRMDFCKNYSLGVSRMNEILFL